jgi:hypothetical protein
MTAIAVVDAQDREWFGNLKLKWKFY